MSYASADANLKSHSYKRTIGGDDCADRTSCLLALDEALQIERCCAHIRVAKNTNKRDNSHGGQHDQRDNQHLSIYLADSIA